MKNFIVREIAKPLVKRVGTAAGALLIAQGIDGSTVEQIVTGLSALGLIAVDLVTRKYLKD